jgi:putative hemolysin
MNRSLRIIVGLLLAALAVGACAPSVPQDTPQPAPVQETPAQLANPASQNCIDQGGTLSMLRGDCPVGGIKVTGYVTPAARFCAITGGEYTVTDGSNTEDEQGTCAFPNGATCDAWDYYRGECDPDS